MHSKCFYLDASGDSLESLGVEHCPAAIHLQVPPTERDGAIINRGSLRSVCVHIFVNMASGRTNRTNRVRTFTKTETNVCVCSCTSTPIVHVPEKLQVELVEGVVDLLPVALHQLCVVHQLLLHTNTHHHCQSL